MTNISITEFWAYIIGAVAVVKTIDWIWGRFVTPKLEKDEKFEKMEKALTEIKEKLDKDYQKLDGHEERIAKLEAKAKDSAAEREDMHNALKVIIVGQQAITKSLLEDGNNKSGLKQAEKLLEEYLTSKV